MIENEILTNDAGEEVGLDTDYLAAIKELKQNSVSRQDYLKLKDENKRLLQSLVNGETIENQVNNVPKLSNDELRDQLFHKELSNLDYCKAALELRENIISEGGKDPFLPQGHNYVVQQSDIDTANKVATVMQECIDYADGNAEIFTNELMRRTNDVKVPNRRR